MILILKTIHQGPVMQLQQPSLAIRISQEEFCFHFLTEINTFYRLSQSDDRDIEKVSRRPSLRLPNMAAQHLEDHPQEQLIENPLDQSDKEYNCDPMVTCQWFHDADTPRHVYKLKEGIIWVQASKPRAICVSIRLLCPKSCDDDTVNETMASLQQYSNLSRTGGTSPGTHLSDRVEDLGEKNRSPPTTLGQKPGSNCIIYRINHKDDSDIEDKVTWNPGDTDREVPVPETFHEQTDDELTEAKIKQMEADDQAIQTILPSHSGAHIYALLYICVKQLQKSTGATPQVLQTPTATTTTADSTPTPIIASSQATDLSNTSQECLTKLEIQEHVQPQTATIADNSSNAMFDEKTFVNNPLLLSSTM
ncbi:hypothetical protein Tco_1474252 [Tanacetum coccineum]